MLNSELLRILRCPECGSLLTFEPSQRGAAVSMEGLVRCKDSGHSFPVRKGIPRFVPAENYAVNFGFQWNEFRKTQLDRHSGTTVSRDRFFAQSGWDPADLRGRWVLDVGCGSGRFAEVALSCGAKVVALDYSSAVDAVADNLGADPNLGIVQGDVFKLPFAPESFDFVYCFGVLQHTPDVRRAFDSLPGVLKRGGKLAVDVYPRLLGNLFVGKYWVRPLLKGMPHERLYELVGKLVPKTYPVARFVARIPLVGRKLRHLLPISIYDGIFPLSAEQLLEWSVLDTFDMLSPVHDHPQSVRSLRQWFREAGLRDVQAFRLGVAVGRGRK